MELQETMSQMHLLHFVKINDIENINKLIEDNPQVLNSTTYIHPYNKPILYLACYDFASIVNETTVKRLIQLGADLHQSDKRHGHKEAIHFATLGQNPLILQTIVDAINVTKLSSLSLGNTALNLLVKQGDAKNENFLKCVAILVEAGVDVNQTDTKGKSPISWAVKRNYKETVKIILAKSKQKVVLDETVCEYLKKNNISAPLRPQLGATHYELLEKLFTHLGTGDEDSFIKCEHLEKFVDADDGVSTFLQLATQRNLVRVVQALLEQGADPNKTASKGSPTPIELAVENGHHRILSHLLEQKKILLPNDILLRNLKHIDDDFISCEINHDKCYALLMKRKNLNVNAKDEFNNTALHYAAKYGGSEKTLDLLRRGASMAVKNQSDSRPIEDIDPRVLQIHLDECLEVNIDENVFKEDFTATFNYRTLMHPQECERDIKNGDVEHGDTEDDIFKLTYETEVVSYMSESPELYHMLTHPVITSLLYMKWHRIRWFFYTNLVFYTLFCLSLILDIFYEKNSSGASFPSILLGTTWVLLVLRELMQIIVSPKTYFTTVDNYLEIILVILTTLILFQKTLSDGVKRQIWAVSILLAAFELVVLIGQHPRMITNIVMLKTVSKNFFKFFLWYSILIFAFSLSFFILFHRDKTNSPNSAIVEPTVFFSPLLSLFKTITMFTGEYETGNIEFQIYPVTSHLIFMIFVFMIAIILFNLLNGLAVSDTQNIKSNAELVGYIAQIEHIDYIEDMFFDYLLTDAFIKYFSCLVSFLKNNNDMVSFLIGRVNLFPFYIQDHKLEIYPNQKGRVSLDNFGNYYESRVICNYTIYLDKQTAKRTKQLIRAKKEAAEEKKEALERKDWFLEEQKKVIDKLYREIISQEKNNQKRKVHMHQAQLKSEERRFVLCSACGAQVRSNKPQTGDASNKKRKNLRKEGIKKVEFVDKIF